MSGQRRRQPSAAQWAYQQNIGETDHDRQDKRDGVRCTLYGGPCDNLHIAKRPRSELAQGRGYAPHYIRQRSDLRNVDYVYKWKGRDAEGVHHYRFIGRQGYHQGRSYDDVMVVFHGGPLHGTTGWCPRSETGQAPVVGRTVDGVEYNEAHVWRDSHDYHCQGYVRIWLSGGSNDRQSAIVQAGDASTPPRGYFPQFYECGTKDRHLMEPRVDYYHWSHDNVYEYSSSDWADKSWD